MFLGFLLTTQIIKIKLEMDILLHCLEVFLQWEFLGLQWRRSHQWWALAALMRAGGGGTTSPKQRCDFFWFFSKEFWKFFEISAFRRDQVAWAETSKDLQHNSEMKYEKTWNSVKILELYTPWFRLSWQIPSLLWDTTLWCGATTVWVSPVRYAKF